MEQSWSTGWTGLKFQPSLRSDRLLLRPFVATDVEALSRHAGAREVADSTVPVPHPYSLGAARAWVAGLSHFYQTRSAVHFAVILPGRDELIGSAALIDIDRENRRAELSFWIGVPWWGKGYATEAAREVLSFGFSQCALNRIYAHHLARTPAPGEVLRKLGMRREGVLRQALRRWDAFEDVVVDSLLRLELPPDTEGEEASTS